MEACGGRGLTLNLGTRWGWMVSVTPRPRFTPGERTPGTHWIGGWVGPRAGLDAETRRKILCPCRGSNPDRPARSQTLYCLSYHGSHLEFLIFINFRIIILKNHHLLPFAYLSTGNSLYREKALNVTLYSASSKFSEKMVIQAWMKTAYACSTYWIFLSSSVFLPLYETVFYICWHNLIEYICSECQSQFFINKFNFHLSFVLHSVDGLIGQMMCSVPVSSWHMVHWN
jgi:hypothetical protein